MLTETVQLEQTYVLTCRLKRQTCDACMQATVCRTILFMNETGWWNVGEQYGVGLMQYLQNWCVAARSSLLVSYY